MTDVYKKVGDKYKKLELSEICSIAEKYIAQNFRRIGESCTTPNHFREFLVMRYGAEEVEHFDVVWMDSQHRPIAVVRLSTGTVDSSTVHIREVVKSALKHNAAACILAHNHPSGVPEPSDADRRLTYRIKNALEMINVRVLDHFVIGGLSSVSLAERNML